MRDVQHDILRFWFEDTAPQIWFQKNDDFAESLRVQFGAHYARAQEGFFDSWNDSAEGALALTLMLDQFPRHMFRGTVRAFQTDEKALFLVKHALSKGFDQILEPVKRGFLYLPFQHSENPEDQARSLTLYTAMKNENPAGMMYAARCYDIIQKFGRFPSRNAALGRENTAAENIFLQEAQGKGGIV